MRKTKNQFLLFGFASKNSWRGGLIIGLVAAGLMLMQGFAYLATYPTLDERVAFAATMVNNPAIKMLYGEPVAVETAPGYMVFRTGAILALVAAIWGLMVATKRFRGTEENGQTELLMSGPFVRRQFAVETMAGIGVGVAAAYAIFTFLIGISGANANMNYDWGAAVFAGMGIFGGAAVFAALGALTSQLANGRRRATLIGVTAIVILFIMRCAGNAVDSLYWLKNFTPFGWIDKLHPLTESQPIWLVPLAIAGVIFAGGAVWICKYRDLGEGILKAREKAKSHLKTVSNNFVFTLRQMLPILTMWSTCVIFVAMLMVVLALTASDAAASSPTLIDATNALVGDSSAGMAIEFMSIGTMMIAVFLAIAVANILGQAKNEEIDGRAENMLVRRVSRVGWLASRTIVFAIAAVVVTIIANVAMWAISQYNGVNLDFAKTVWGGLNIIGPVVLALGIGVLAYGIWPRIAAWVLYVWVVYSFFLSMISSVAKFPGWLNDTSLVKWISLTPAASANWKWFGVTLAIGVAAFAAGLILFARRDIQTD